jgi:hypothetical protein
MPSEEGRVWGPSPGPAFARILNVPASRRDLGPFYRDVIAADPLEPYGAASAAYRLQVLARTLPFPVSGARLVPSNNNDVWRTEAGYLRVAWRGAGAAWPGRLSSWEDCGSPFPSRRSWTAAAMTSCHGH